MSKTPSHVEMNPKPSNPKEPKEIVHKPHGKMPWKNNGPGRNQFTMSSHNLTKLTGQIAILALAMIVLGCGGQPASVKSESASEGVPPVKATVALKKADTETEAAKISIKKADTALVKAETAKTLPEALPSVKMAHEAVRETAVHVGAADVAVEAAQPAAVAGEKAEKKLEQVQSYDWLRISLISVGSAAGALLALFGAVCLFSSLASSTILGALPVIGGLIQGARSALYIVMGELTIIVAICAYLAAHIVQAVNFGFGIAAVFVIYLCVRFAIKHHLAAKAGPVAQQIADDVKPAGLWIEHKIADAWRWVSAKITSWLPHKAPTNQSPPAPKT